VEKMENEQIEQTFKKTNEDLNNQNKKIDMIYNEISSLKSFLKSIATEADAPSMTIEKEKKVSTPIENIKNNDRTNIDYINIYFQEVKEIMEMMDKNEIDKAINILFEAWRNDRQIFIVGNGGSASTATHFAADLTKTAIVKGKKRFKGISLFDNVPLVSAWINDEGWENVYLGQLENFFQKGDVVIGVSVHGGSGKANAGQWSQNIPRAMQYAKDNGGKIIGLAGFDGGLFKEICDACIIVPKDSTPLVEGFHVDIQHLIVFRLRELISNYTERTDSQLY
jgi:D-sedoheptulose 7-phosphate isomerase